MDCNHRISLQKFLGHDNWQIVFELGLYADYLKLYIGEKGNNREQINSKSEDYKIYDFIRVMTYT